MNIVIWLMTFFLVLNCLLLILLVLIQLPKKEAGLGQAFGSGATDALFGAGSGNALTKMTKYAAGVFFVLTLFISILQGHQVRSKSADPRLSLTAEEKLAGIPSAPPAKTNAPAIQTPANLNASLSNMLSSSATNRLQTNLAPASASTNK
jgi:preprotein translocase subunit SecG